MNDAKMNRSDLDTVIAHDTGYRMLRDFMRLRVRNPWPVVEIEWASVEEASARMEKWMNDIPGLGYTPPSPLVISAHLLTAMGDFIEWSNPESQYSLAHQLENRAEEWDRRLAEMLDQMDDDE